MPLMPDPAVRAFRRPAPFIVSQGMPEMPVSHHMWAWGFTGPVSNVYPTANLLIAVPFVLGSSAIAYQLALFNGTVVSGNIDMAILDESGNRLVSSGSTAQAGTSALQLLNITDTELDADTLYYLAVAINNTTATVFRWVASTAAVGRMGGLRQAATSFVIPSTVTLATWTGTQMPCMGVDLRGTTF